LKLDAALRQVNAALARKKRDRPGIAWCPHAPHPKQAEFLALDCLEALYGGAAGGGKSDALLMAALQYVHVPGYSALILRRTYADLALPKAIMDRAKEWLMPQGVKWNDTDKRFTFPSGAVLTFGYLNTENDKFRYQSAEFQFVAFDELTQFPEGWFRYLHSRLRRLEGMPVPLRMRAASNPGGIGHEWVKRRFIDSPGSRVFVPAKLEDNPSLDREEYVKSLAELDAATRKQLLEGVWIRDTEGLVYKYDDAKHGIDDAPPCTAHILGIDYGFTDSTAFCVLGARKHDKTVYVVEATKQTQMTPGKAAEVVKELNERYKFERIVADIGGLGKGYAEEAISRFRIPIEAAEKKNKRGYIDLLNGDLEAGRVKFVRRRCVELTSELAELPWNEARTKPEEGFEDHLCDALLYGWRASFAYLQEPSDEPPKAGTKEWEDAQRAIRRKEFTEEKAEKREYWRRPGRRA
jgi:hypothetical protein